MYCCPQFNKIYLIRSNAAHMWPEEKRKWNTNQRAFLSVLYLITFIAFFCPPHPISSADLLTPTSSTLHQPFHFCMHIQYLSNFIFPLHFVPLHPFLRPTVGRIVRSCECEVINDWKYFNPYTWLFTQAALISRALQRGVKPLGKLTKPFIYTT